jgi:SAM-dependent methyltransferase
MPFDVLKSFLTDRPVLTRIWRGPFRGARIVMNPRDSFRKMFGLYEHELNEWLAQSLRRVTRVLDIGANDGYFTFGCAAAFQRLGKGGEIVAFEPQPRHVAILRESLAAQPGTSVRFEIVQAFVGRELKPGMTTLDAVRWTAGNPTDRTSTLVKIVVEGAEIDVLEGACSWIVASNLFVIEVHHEAFLAQLKQMFEKRGLQLLLVNQRPLPLMSREKRKHENWWLVSDLSASH